METFLIILKAEKVVYEYGPSEALFPYSGLVKIKNKMLKVTIFSFNAGCCISEH
jgi:hypothetical protein